VAGAVQLLNQEAGRWPEPISQLTLLETAPNVVNDPIGCCGRDAVPRGAVERKPKGVGPWKHLVQGGADVTPGKLFNPIELWGHQAGDFKDVLLAASILE
jgi:hypothetical protein